MSFYNWPRVLYTKTCSSTVALKQLPSLLDTSIQPWVRYRLRGHYEKLSDFLHTHSSGN
ncbi:unnamed protein product [Blumeria hordei]|uniref:Uncharacterized protein n=1 Tax=Blumeria hordei TaxID=2867405 RepID=A0A383UXB4_BLUHO|nr:unnamed protein product [Blumeria hordei]